jgi:hypothetical protein
MGRLLKFFNEIRSYYFPRWDIERKWAIEERTRRPGTIEDGGCDTENKTICVSPLREHSDGELYVLIIHEICHAVTTLYHGKKFKSRLLKAANKAQDMGNLTLAEKLRAEANLYAPGRDSAYTVYCAIEDAVWDAPDASMDAVLRWVCDYTATVQEMLEQYPKAEKVYKKAIAGVKLSKTG